MTAAGPHGRGERGDVLTVTVTADASYLPHVAAMLHSAVSVPGQPPLEVHLLHPGDIGRRAQPLARMLARHRGILVEHRVEPHWLAGISDKRFSITAWYRILAPVLLPAHHRALHLDGDMLVEGVLSELWGTALRGAPFAAAQNPLYPWMAPSARRLGLPPGTPYPNSGVLLMDLGEMRRCSAVEDLISYGRSHPDNPWPEQDALAAVFQGCWVDLHPRWNLQSTTAELPTRHLPWTRAEVVEARTSPMIRHFSGPLKPWDGWGARRTVQRYVDHRRGSGYPMPAHPPRRPSSAMVRRLPMRLRRRALLRILRSKGGS